jgi:hypothetical protein
MYSKVSNTVLAASSIARDAINFTAGMITVMLRALLNADTYNADG